MSAADLTTYVAGLRARLAVAGAVDADLNALSAAAEQLGALFAGPPPTEQVWTAAVAEWEEARVRILGLLLRATVGSFAEIPGLSGVFGDAESVARTGAQANLAFGPLHVRIASGVLYINPPQLVGGAVLEPIAVGPLQLASVEATIDSPIGGGVSLPGGGSLIRLAGSGGGEGWGGRLQVPVPPVLVDASAILGFAESGPSFLAVLGLQFVPPIQLSFGFSLDRVGGVVGINRTIMIDELRAAIRTGAAGDAFFQIRPPDNPGAFVATLDRLLPRRNGVHIVGPSLKLSWLSLPPSGSLVSLDLAVLAEVPSGRVVVLGVAQMTVPSAPGLLNFRLDLLGLIDVLDRLVTIDASLVDSHLLGVFEVYGDAAMRVSWGSEPYVVISVGGFFPGFDPKPAKLPALRRVGMAQSVPGSGLDLRVEGYFAVTANSIQIGGRVEARISRIISAHGFIEADVLVHLRPFHFEANISAGFSVGVHGLSFASVHLSGQISGPGPLVVHGSLSISVFLLDLSWDQTFTLGSGPADALPPSRPLLDVLTEELTKRENLHATMTSDPQVVLAPLPPAEGFALVPPTGTLQIMQRLAPLGIPLDRVRGVPLPEQQGAVIAGAGPDVQEGFAPATFLNLTDAETLNRPAFENLDAGKVLMPNDPALSSFPVDEETEAVQQIVIDTRSSGPLAAFLGAVPLDLLHASGLVECARTDPALSDSSPMLTTGRESWVVIGTGDEHRSATAAHQFARSVGRVAVASTDLADPVVLNGVW